MDVIGLACNYLTNPLGVETPCPRLSWKLESDRRGCKQTAYRILAASSPEGLATETADVWDSGKVDSDASLFVQYEGPALSSRQRVWWCVCVWDEHDTPSNWSAPAFWEMGLLSQDEWTGKWIGRFGCLGANNWEPGVLLRKMFTVAKPVRQARAYVTGLGYYEMRLNGGKVGDEILTPAPTHYERRVCYQTYDVTEQLNVGENAVGMMLGDGWYNHRPKDCWDFYAASWRGTPRCHVQLFIDYEDGTQEIVRSDTSWRVLPEGPIIANGLRCGEWYDARKEQPGWDTPNFDDSEWLQAAVQPGPGGMLHSQQTTPIRITRTLSPKDIREIEPGIFVADFGENISGWCRIDVEAPEGTEISLRYAEKILENGDIDQANISSLVWDCEFQNDKYICKGKGKETWEPRFTYHGFQYVQVTGWPGALTPDAISACILNTDFETRAEFKCSNDLLNQIQECTLRATVGNFHGFPTDCPHREKNGWTGDAHLSAEECLLNFNPMTAYTKWMRDFRDLQRENGALPAIVPTGGWGFNWGNGPAWDSAAFLIPWYMYQYCGDIGILAEQYELMKKYIRHLDELAVFGIVSYGLGDWCPPNRGAAESKCPASVTSTAYYYVDVRILAQTARLLGEEDAATQYDDKAAYVREAFRREFVDLSTGKVEGDTQTSYACALYQGMVDAQETDALFSHLLNEVAANDTHFDTGILGTKYILHVLSDHEHADIAYKLLTQTDFPSYGHWIAQGATTLWENWDGCASRNHHMFGDVSAWFYRALAGISPAEPGFRHILVRPHFVDGLDWVDAWHDSLYGRIAVSWKKQDGAIALELTVPPNTTATVSLPSTFAGTIFVDGESVAAESFVQSAGRVETQVASGTYSFRLG